MQYFLPQSIAKGMKRHALDHLSDADKRIVLTLMARISEKSYRRGFQHGVVIGDRRTIDPVDLRLGRSLNRSPYTDGPGGFSAAERLDMEYGVLAELGFDPWGFER
jgi:hypothetical protein